MIEEAIEICKARQVCLDDTGWPIKKKYFDAENGKSSDAVRYAFSTARLFMRSTSLQDLTNPAPWMCAQAVLSMSLCSGAK